MSSEVWSNEGERPQKRSGVPGWVWFCGGGCLLMLVCVVVLLVLGVKLVKEGLDPELQWPKLREAIAVDEDPQDLRLMFGSSFFGTYFMEDGRGYTLLVFVKDRADAAEIEPLFASDFTEGGSSFGMEGVQDVQLGTIEVQGRERRIQRFFQSGGASRFGAPGQPELGSGHSAFVDITPEEGEQIVVGLVVRVRAGEDPLGDDEVRDVLAPFHVGPVREPVKPAEPAEPGRSEQPAEDGR